ncbi:unnamed protein product, partial [Mesorhabditis belari]|uniref:CHK kinase-like domain-containing protein n=1 Tax=Mesorhabditis belari TaxID=2138241 RepID=A0AAF3FS25_9BILA
MGYLAEEYVVGEMLQIYQEVPDDGVLQVLDQLVQLAATSLKNPDILKVWDNAAMNALLAQGRTIAKIDGRLNTMKDLYPKLTSQIDKMLAKTNLIFGDFKRFMDLRKSTSDRQVLCHGDMWTPNVLWQRNVNGSVDLAAILDWQLLNVGSPTEDLVYFLHSALSPETYPKKKNDYLHYYYDNLKQSVTNLPMPWSNLENFIQQYEVSYTYCIMVLMPWYTTAKEQLLGTYINNPSFVDAFDEKIKFMTNETIRCINKWF